MYGLLYGQHILQHFPIWYSSSDFIRKQLTASNEHNFQFLHYVRRVSMEMESMSLGFLKIVSLSRVAFLINIIFVCSCQKHNFLVHSLSHSKLSHFFSSHTLTDINSGLSSSHRSLSLSLHVSLPLYNTILWLDSPPPPHTDQPIALTCKRE